ncbi:uncharacterized protein [Amphiura filiformis]|uniref:uncharacterized protein n=1 Tax=Amphiura filiformis TaxID=82378 RepID=UPI003B228AE4
MKTLLCLLLPLALVATLVSARPPRHGIDIADCPVEPVNCQFTGGDGNHGNVNMHCNTTCLHVHYPCPEDCIEDDDPSCSTVGPWCPMRAREGRTILKKIGDCPVDCTDVDDPALCDVGCLHRDFPCPDEDCTAEGQQSCTDVGSWCPKRERKDRPDGHSRPSGQDGQRGAEQGRPEGGRPRGPPRPSGGRSSGERPQRGGRDARDAHRGRRPGPAGHGHDHGVDITDCPTTPDNCQFFGRDENMHCNITCLYEYYPCPEDCVDEDDPSCSTVGPWCPKMEREDHHDERPRGRRPNGGRGSGERPQRGGRDARDAHRGRRPGPAGHGHDHGVDITDCPTTPDNCQFFGRDENMHCNITCLYEYYPCPEDCVDEDDPSCSTVGPWCPKMEREDHHDERPRGRRPNGGRGSGERPQRGGRDARDAHRGRRPGPARHGHDHGVDITDCPTTPDNCQFIGRDENMHCNITCLYEYYPCPEDCVEDDDPSCSTVGPWCPKMEREDHHDERPRGRRPNGGRGSGERPQRGGRDARDAHRGRRPGPAGHGHDHGVDITDCPTTPDNCQFIGRDENIHCNITCLYEYYPCPEDCIEDDDPSCSTVGPWCPKMEREDHHDERPRGRRPNGGRGSGERPQRGGRDARDAHRGRRPGPARHGHDHCVDITDCPTTPDNCQFIGRDDNMHCNITCLYEYYPCPEDCVDEDDPSCSTVGPWCPKMEREDHHDERPRGRRPNGGRGSGERPQRGGRDARDAHRGRRPGPAGHGHDHGVDITDCPTTPDNCQFIGRDENMHCNITCLYEYYPCPEDCVEDDDPSCSTVGPWCPKMEREDHHDERPRGRRPNGGRGSGERPQRGGRDARDAHRGRRPGPAGHGHDHGVDITDCPTTPDNCQFIGRDENMHCNITCLYEYYPCPGDCVEDDDPSCSTVGPWCPKREREGRHQRGGRGKRPGSGRHGGNRPGQGDRPSGPRPSGRRGRGRGGRRH